MLVAMISIETVSIKFSDKYIKREPVKGLQRSVNKALKPTST